VLNTLRNRLVSIFAALAVLASCFAASPALRAQSADSASPKSLEGAWWVTVTLYNCATGDKRPPFTSMLLFSRGGTLTETTSNSTFLNGQRSVGFGTWTKADNGTYTASDVAYILFTGGIFTAGTQKISHTITLDNNADTFTDEAIVQFFTTTGAPLNTGCATASGTRLK
jgi:hypothetical protein